MKRLNDVFVSMLLLINRLDITMIFVESAEHEVCCRSISSSIEVSIDQVQIHSNSWLVDFFLDYLFCIDIKEDYYNEDDFYQWICDDLLSHCNIYSTNHSVIVMNNVSIHINSRIWQTIKAHDCRIKYLSLYSFNYNPIELSFSVLKAWMRWHFHEVRSKDTFEEFLHAVLDRSQCDQFAVQHFKHSAQKGYIFEDDIRKLYESLYADYIWKRYIDLTDVVYQMYVDISCGNPSKFMTQIAVSDWMRDLTKLNENSEKNYLENRYIRLADVACQMKVVISCGNTF